MTNSQCIEVAEKIWGMGTSTPQIWWDTVEAEVNSWNGFGRTVEAMAEKKGDFSCDDGCVYFAGFSPDVGGYQVNLFNKEQFIEATHLAALEALE